MTKTIQVRFSTVLLALLTCILVVLGWLNFQQRNHFLAPEDGVSWLDSPDGVTAWIVAHDGPADRAGIHQGDRLLNVAGVPVHMAADVTRTIYQAGVWMRITYDLIRDGQRFQVNVITVPQQTPSSLTYFREIIGLLYLFIGAFIFFRRWSAPHSLHFYIFCLASFVFYTFSYTTKLNAFDLAVYWMSVLAWIAMPGIFLHFCLKFPERPAVLKDRSYVMGLIYAPGALLLLAHVLIAHNIMTLDRKSVV